MHYFTFKFNDKNHERLVCLIVSYHVYKDIWKPVIGETLTCDIEPKNIHDPYVVKVTFQGLVVEHVHNFFQKL